jgi:hypothetical protein
LGRMAACTGNDRVLAGPPQSAPRPSALPPRQHRRVDRRTPRALTPLRSGETRDGRRETGKLPPACSFPVSCLGVLPLQLAHPFFEKETVRSRPSLARPLCGRATRPAALGSLAEGALLAKPRWRAGGRRILFANDSLCALTGRATTAPLFTPTRGARFSTRRARKTRR